VHFLLPELLLSIREAPQNSHTLGGNLNCFVRLLDYFEVVEHVSAFFFVVFGVLSWRQLNQIEHLEIVAEFCVAKLLF